MRKAIVVVITAILFCSCLGGRINAAHKAALIDYIPYNAEIAGIRVGYNTVGQLEHRLWPGSTFYRDRPDQASVWKVKSTGWIVQFNDGDHKHTEQKLFFLSIRMPNDKYSAPTKEKVCDVALPPRLLRFNKQIKLGMAKSKVLSILHAEHIPTSGMNNVSWTYEGAWQMSFEFQRGKLVSMGMNYS